MTARWLNLIGAVLLLGAAPPARERVVTSDGVVAAEVNGVPARIRIDPGALAMPMIDADLAARAGLHTGSPLLGKHWGIGFGMRVGPTLVMAPSAQGKIDVGDGTFAHRIAWNARRYQPDVDGVIGPGGVRNALVRFQLRAPMQGERTATFPLVEDSELFVGTWGASYAAVMVETLPLRVRFAPRVPRSYLAAQGAVRVAAALGGRFEGAAAEEPIMFGIARPVRPMALAHPLTVGPLSLARVGVRTAEGGNTAAIPDGAASSADPDEVVVTAKAKGKPRPGTLTLGQDALSRCSSIVFDKPAKQVRLTCA